MKEYVSEFNKVVFKAITRYYPEKSKAALTIITLSCRAVAKGRKIANNIIENEIMVDIKSNAFDEKRISIADEEINKATEQFFIENKEEVLRLPISYRKKGRKTLKNFVHDAMRDGYRFELKLIYKMLTGMDIEKAV